MQGRYIGDGRDTSAPTDDRMSLLISIIGPLQNSSIQLKGCRGINELAFASKACHNWLMPGIYKDIGHNPGSLKGSTCYRKTSRLRFNQVSSSAQAGLLKPSAGWLP